MGIIGFIAILATFLLLPLGLDKRTPVPLSVLLAIPLVQLGGLFAALAFIAARPFDTDTVTYFYDVLGALADGIKPGTSFIVYLTTFITRLTRGSFDDLMAVYSISGVVASLLLVRYPSFAGYQGAFPVLSGALILLPTFHFYTTAIGKDGLSALAITLIIIGALNFPSRVKTFALGFVLLILVRPHIAAFASVAFMLSQMIGSNSKAARLSVIPILLVSPIIGYFVFQSFVGVDIFDFDQLSSFFAERSDSIYTSTYVINSDQNPFIRVFGFLYFPLFFNADNSLAIFASFENLLLIIITARVISSVTICRLYRKSEIRFLLILLTFLTLFMGLTNYNIGLGLRLKSSMLFPVVMALLSSTEMLRRRSGKHVAQPSHETTANGSFNPPELTQAGTRIP